MLETKKTTFFTDQAILERYYKHISLVVFLALYSVVCNAQGNFQFLGYAQLTAEYFDSDDKLNLDADRIRLSGIYSIEKFSTRLMLDLNAGDLNDRPPGTLANVIKDLWVGYQINMNHELKVGQFKTPIGLDFNLPAQSLLITKRGMEKGLVFERDLGVMISGRRLAEGFGYDLGIFNIAGRSAATQYTDDQAGDAYAWTARVMVDSGPWHGEVSYGLSEEAGGLDSNNYSVFDIAGSFKHGPWTLTLEWIDGSDVRGIKNRNERVAYAHLGYRFTPRLEFVTRYYDGESKLDGQTTRLSNTYIGGNIHLLKHKNYEGRLQINYMLAGGNESIYTGVSGFRSDAFLIQFQWLVRN